MRKRLDFNGLLSFDEFGADEEPYGKVISLIENIAVALVDALTGFGFDVGKDFLISKKRRKKD